MANQEHVELVCAGAVAVKQWRAEHSHAGLDLRGAVLSNADLRGVDFTRADLHEGNLSGAQLEGAIFSRALFEFTDLTGANLEGASLDRARLYYVRLQDSNLHRANLMNASLEVTELDNADFTEAHVGWTRFADLDLSVAKALEFVSHGAPSTLGIDVLYRSGGNIPEVFLRGAGVPDSLITYMRSLTARPIEFYSCFISYSHADKSFARRLHDTLQGRGIRCWLDEHQLLPGDDIYEATDRGIRLWDKVLLCCSKTSLSSWWVDKEVNT